MDKPHELDDETITVYARVVGMNEDFIWNMADDSLPESINYFYDNSSQNLIFNPLYKVVELFSEKDKLYERMLSEKEKVNDYLEKALDKLSK